MSSQKNISIHHETPIGMTKRRHELPVSVIENPNKKTPIAPALIASAPISERGPTGATGTRGMVGPTGVTGEKGGQGIAGAQGVTGPTGMVGPQGVPGTFGDEDAHRNIVPYRHNTINVGSHDHYYRNTYTQILHVGDTRPIRFNNHLYMEVLSDNTLNLPANTKIGGLNVGSIVVKGMVDESALTALSATAEIGDAYVVDGELRTWNGTEFANIGKLQGQTGPTGYMGYTGYTGITGTTGPTGGTGPRGDFYDFVVNIQNSDLSGDRYYLPQDSFHLYTIDELFDYNGIPDVSHNNENTNQYVRLNIVDTDVSMLLFNDEISTMIHTKKNGIFKRFM